LSIFQKQEITLALTTKSQRHTKMFIKGLILASICLAAASDVAQKRDGKLLSVFQVVKFPNGACEVSGGSQNGTCYTTEECSNRDGTADGECADGYGVCCIFKVGCGTKTSENNTYFEATSLSSGECTMTTCPSNSNICQIRLDFDTFVVTGPSTETTVAFEQLNGNALKTGNGKDASLASTCATDVFHVTNAPNLPELCGTLSGEHVYFEANNACHDLTFNLGQVGVDATLATRKFSIKVTQFTCDYANLAPTGCDQYFFNDAGTGTVQTFNYGAHLANQHQTICVRRELNQCKICWYAVAVTDVRVSGSAALVKNVVDQSVCCGYGAEGTKTSGYDCLMIPGAAKKADSAPVPPTQCGGLGGLVTASGTTPATICSRSSPFRIEFFSDGFEVAGAILEAMTKPVGFKVNYDQATCT
jgi:hypothetical protein